MTARPRPALSFQARITIAAMATAVGVLAVACASFGAAQWESERASFTYHQKLVIQALTEQLVRAAPQGPAAEEAVLKGLALNPRVVFAEVSDAHGRTLARYRRPGPVHGFLLHDRAPLVVDGKPVGEMRIDAASQTMGSFIPRHLAIVGALFFMATALSMFLARLMAERVIEPVGRLSLVMQEVARTRDLARRVQKTEDDEFGRLIDSFNALLGRLEANERDLRQTLAALLEARDAAEAANVQKSQFLANMSHEIRTPLNGVLAMAQILERGALSGGQREQVEVIKSSGEVLLTILNDILDVSRIEDGALELEVAPFDLAGLIQATLGGYAAAAQTKGLDLTVEIAEGAQGLRLGDGGRVRQILSNLVSNAIKFTAKGGVAVRVEGSDTGVRLTVKDTGVGVPEDRLAHLFDKFTQLDGATTRRFGGAGLGLAICQALTEKMGGVIAVESAPGEGSTFVVDLPLPRCEDPAEATATAADPASDGETERPLRVLAAEDNPTNQKVLATILGMFGVDLQMVENGVLAVEAWRSAPFDVILMDIQMPDMDGVAAARAIRAAEAETGRARIPILAVTANAMAHQAAEYAAAGMDGLVPKPIEIGRLQAALEGALAGAEAARTAA
jgi:signal transduction histidine kinase/ActR/RegA family two-component response regulator